MRVYAIFDRKAKHIVSMFTSVSDEAAERSFLMLLTGSDDSLFTNFPEDFSLFALCDLIVNGVGITVTQIGNEVLQNSGFKVNSFDVYEAIKDGFSFDRAYLKMVRDFRSKESEIPTSINGGCKDE